MTATIKEKGFKPGSFFNFTSVRKVLDLTSGFRGKLYLAFVLTISISFLGPVRPFMIQRSIDKYIALNDKAGLIQITAIIISLLIIQSAMQVWATILTNFIGQEVIKDLRLKVYQYLTSLRIRFYDQTPVGTMVTRTISDIETIADVFSEGLINIAGDLLQIIFLLILMFYTDWKLTLISLSVLPLLLYAGYIFKEKVRLSFIDVRNQVARLNTFVQEHIQGMQIVQLFNRQNEEYDRFEKINELHRDANIRAVMYYSVFFPAVEMIAAISTGLILWYGSKGVIAHETSIGTLIAFIMYINLFFRPIRQMADRFNTIQMGMVSSDRIFKLIEDNDNKEPIGSVIPIVRGEVAFNHVWFAYSNEEFVLKDINFHIKPGKTIALVGATGSGKTTITHLIHKFYQINKGDILFDGLSIDTLNNNALRKQIGTVLQDVFLFSGSILDNIRLYNEDISEEKIIATAKLLGADHFISNLPNGYHQQVNERGLSLSVGQRQLISFVRAMVAEPAILILDEATASIDHETEEIIQSAINKMLIGRTCIIIAHRLSTIQHVDEILVMDKGQIVERGSHSELLAQNGLYKNLYEVQFANQHI